MTSSKNTRPKSTRPEVARPKAAHSKSARPEVVRPKAARSNSARPEVARPENTQPEVVRPKSVRPKAARLEVVRPKSARPKITARFIARTGMIAAVYAALTILTITLLQGLAWGPVQFRIAEAVCVLAILTRAGVPGLTIGCIFANLIGIALTGSGALGLLDVVCGSLATFLGALWAWKMRERPAVALLGPVVANALIVAAYLPLILAAYGFYTIPFTDIDLVGNYPLMYLFGVLAIGVGEALVVYVIGLPLLRALKNLTIFASD